MYQRGLISISAGTDVRRRQTWHEDGVKWESYEKAKVSKMEHIKKESQNFVPGFQI